MAMTSRMWMKPPSVVRSYEAQEPQNYQDHEYCPKHRFIISAGAFSISVADLRIGIHTSRAGSLENAALKAGELGANTFQIFSSSPRMWRASVPEAGDVRRFQAARERLDLWPLAIHTNYLVNLATLDPSIRERSVASFRGELERAATIGAEYLVLHPGNYKGQSVEQGIAAFVLGLAEAARGFQGAGVTVLLENTVGGGCQIGSAV